jgi:TonB-linked SusC/RagA family outer membrane protein
VVPPGGHGPKIMQMKRQLLFSLLATLVTSFALAQQDVTGRVTDARDNSALSGVSVFVKGTHTGTTTNQDGRFRISVPANAVLVFTFTGFSDKEVTVTGSSVDVALEVTQKSLQEVIVTGYALQNKRQSSGSVAKVSGEEIKLQPLGSFDKALQGKVPGLLSQSSTGQPGAAAEVTIRGKGSINGTNTPLYIVDGVQINSADFATINPGDIESYTVLKDASSTSIYGSRGANGVIVLTTKKGRPGQTQINYDFQYGWSQLPENRLEVMTSKEKLQYEFYDRPDFGINPFGWSDAQVDSLGKIGSTIEKSLFQKGITQQHQLSAAGGNDKTRFYLSGSIFDQQGIVKTTGLRRYTGRVNVENSFGNFKTGINATFGYSRIVGTRENDTYVGSPLNAIRWFNPYLSLYDANGEYQDDYLQNQPNPLRELLENNGHGDQMKGVGNVYIEFNLPWVKGLKLKTLWGADFTSDEAFLYLDRNTDQGSQSTGGNGQVSRSYTKTFRYTGTTSLSYQRTMGAHEITAALFNEIIQAKSDGFNFNGFGLVGPFKNEAGITPGTPDNGYIPTVGGDGTQSGLVSYFADATYGYARKYYISAGARRDGSSRLTKSQRWANFGSVGASWIVSEEKFLEGTRGWLSSLKLKASYGSVGSQGIGNFTSRELLSSTVYNGVGGLVLTNLQRPLTWERKLMFNTGFEFSLWNGRVGGTVEYYNNKTKDLFLDRQLSRTSGFTSITNNLGKLQNTGIELSLNAVVVRTRDFLWEVDGNFTHNKNKLLDQNGMDENISGYFINKVGQPINSIYLVKYAGVDPATGDALYYTKDGKSTTHTYDPADRVLLGTTDPPYFGGFSNTFNYKGLELNTLFSYAFGHWLYNNDRVQVENPIYWYSNLSKNMLREWQHPGDITDVPSPFNDFRQEVSRFVEKGDFLRLRNVMVSYTFQKGLMDRWKMKSLRVFAQAQNLYVWHNFQSYDPEATGGGLGGAQYPQLRTFTLGVNVGL